MKHKMIELNDIFNTLDELDADIVRANSFMEKSQKKLDSIALMILNHKYDSPTNELLSDILKIILEEKYQHES